MNDDAQLIERMKVLLKREAELDLEMIEVLREIHRRKLYVSHGTQNFHDFCTKVLGMSGDSAWRRIHAASLVERFPDVVKPLIAESKVHLTGLAMLDKVITPENGERLLLEAAGKSKTQIKAIIAREDPKPDCKAGVRKLPAKAADLEQLSEETWRFQANLDAEGHALVAEVADLLGSDDCNAMLKRALKTLRDELRVTKQKRLKRQVSKSAGATQSTVTPSGDRQDASSKDDDAPLQHQLGVTQQCMHAVTRSESDDAPVRQHDPSSRRVPRWMEREVRERDGHRCTFVGTGGRCTAARALQVHHVVAVALGGLTEIGNLTLHCGSHNRYQAELDLGVEVANAWRGGGAGP